MINTNTSIASVLSNLYSSTGSQMTQIMSQIASGKRVQNPGDDFAAYVKAASDTTDITSYQNIKQNLTDAKGLTDYAQGVGNNILSDLTQLKDISASYTAAAGDTTQQASLKSQYDSIVSRITDEKTNSMYNGTAVYSNASLSSVAVNTGTGVINITATAVGNEGAINNITTATAANIQSEIANAQAYVSDMSSFGTEIDRSSALSDTIISSKQASVSALTDINEAQSMTDLTNLQVRQQAIVSMMSQANTSQAGIARLFA